MNREDIIRMARKAGFEIDEASRQYQPKCISFTHYLIDDELSRFAALVAAAEREACVQACESLEGSARLGFIEVGIDDDTVKVCAAAIRARGNT